MKFLNDYLRREQVLGNLDSEFSFNIRPIYPTKAFPNFTSSFLTDSIKNYYPLDLFKKNKSKKIRLSALPVQFTSVYNSTFPSGWTNGELIPTKGLQSLISLGAHLKLGKLSIQFYPSFHYAQNLSFEEYPENAPKEYFTYLSRSVSSVDNPVRFGNKSLADFSFGNSHIMMNLGGISFGFSSENLWSGPGQLNSLVLSDNAPGFNHFRVQTTRPLQTFLGSFEGNYWIGQLNNSSDTHFSDGSNSNLLDGEKENDWRYFTGITLSYSPKWTPGLSLGLTRGFQIYRGDMENNFKAYFPLFAPFQKEEEGLIDSRNKRQDQNVSVFTRWVIPTAKIEFYFEFSRNDHPLNYRDLVINPEHSRAFQLGFSKYISLPNSYSLGIQGEVTQTQFSINNIARWANYLGSSNSGRGSYDNFQVKHGWTNRGQLLGANTGVSGNSQTLKIGLYSGLKEISLKLESKTNNPNFYQFANTAGLEVKPWIDYSAHIKYTNSFNNLLLSGSMGFINSLNFNHWQTEKNEFNSTSDPKFNFNLNLTLIYLL